MQKDNLIEIYPDYIDDEGYVQRYNYDKGRYYNTGTCLKGPKGNCGNPGRPGKDGLTPRINQDNGHWMIGDVDTGVMAGGGQSDWNQNDSTKLDYIKNKPTILSGSVILNDSYGAFDLSVHNAVNGVPTTYTDLSTALTALNALDSTYKKPGMSFRFVRTSDNKYVQYLSKSQSFSTNESDWLDITDAISNVSKISKEIVLSEEKTIQITNDAGTEVIHEITENNANFTNLKSNNKTVATLEDLEGKANKSEMSVTDGTGANADKTTIQLKTGTSATVLKAHQNISGKQDVKTQLSFEYISDDNEKSIEIQDDNGNTIHKITENDADFKDLKSNGIPVKVFSEISEDKIIDDSEEIEIKSNNENTTYAKLGTYGIKSKAYLDMGGNDIFVTHKPDYIRHLASNTNCPIVVFKYDDNPPEDDTLIELLDARGLKGTLACMGLDVDIYPTQAKTLGEKLHRWYLNGHGVIGHGITGGVSVLGWGGLNCMPDDDCYKQIEANIKFFETFGLPHKGLGIFNIWEYNPHTVKILGRYYDYMFESGSGMNTPDTDLYKLSAYNTDGANMLTNAKKLVDAAIGKNCIIGFGGHMTRTGKGSTDSRYCTMEQFEELLDYIAEKVNNHQMISLSIDDALELFCARGNAMGGIKSTKQYAPAVGQTYLGQSGIEVCANEGDCAIFDIAISGTVSAGTIQLSNISTTQVNTSAISTQVVDYLEVTLTDETTIEEVIGTFLKSIYREYTVRAKDSSTLRMYADVAKAMDTPSVVENTTGLTLTITRVQQGSEPTWL